MSSAMTRTGTLVSRSRTGLTSHPCAVVRVKVSRTFRCFVVLAPSLPILGVVLVLGGGRPSLPLRRRHRLQATPSLARGCHFFVSGLRPVVRFARHWFFDVCCHFRRLSASGNFADLGGDLPHGAITVSSGCPSVRQCYSLSYHPSMVALTQHHTSVIDLHIGASTWLVRHRYCRFYVFFFHHVGTSGPRLIAHRDVMLVSWGNKKLIRSRRSWNQFQLQIWGARLAHCGQGQQRRRWHQVEVERRQRQAAVQRRAAGVEVDVVFFIAGVTTSQTQSRRQTSPAAAAVATATVVQLHHVLSFSLVVTTDTK